MRPRVFPAEDRSIVSLRDPANARFNEAAGIPRGRRRLPDGPACQLPCFNEAAGIPRGRLGW